ARQADPVAVADPAHFSLMRMDVQDIFGVPDDVLRASCLCAHVVLAEYPTRREDQREPARRLLTGRHVLGREELAFATHELMNVHRRRAIRGGIVARPLDAAEAVELL